MRPAVVYSSAVEYERYGVSAVIRVATVGIGEPTDPVPCDLPAEVRVALLQWLGVSREGR